MPLFCEFKFSGAKTSCMLSKGVFLVISEDHVWFEDRWMVASLCDE
jgi:hypothetical protein